ncbi:hypothetical protein yc1106_09836 [Curvularia clavata]|uniref:BZIP transcription factor n=1 Tax=Curvularia clavata TaxID=95742 RepID=A0A9Q8ZIG0_CURCL|nr:hypothetical protein yc1106_09836 [Curvularia clavata]
MGKHELSDAASSRTPIAPKRKRPVSCLDEQERRERKRAMDREAQRSLREKTKTRLAELERTIEILREKDGNSATANLISEIDALRAENKRLRQIIDNVRSLVGGGIASQNIMAARGEEGEKDEDSSSTATNTGPSLPELLTPFVNHNAKVFAVADANQPISTEQATFAKQAAFTEPPTSIAQPIFFDQPTLTGSIDLDGMSLMTDTHVLGSQDTNQHADPSLELQLHTESVQEQEEEDPSVKIQRETTFKAMLQDVLFHFSNHLYIYIVRTNFTPQIFGPGLYTPSPTIQYIGNPAKVPQPTPSAPLCPVWAKVNQILNRIFTYRSHGNNRILAGRQSQSRAPEAGVLYLGIKNGWDTIPAFEWQYYPTLELVKQIDELAFHQLPKTERLAIGYKSLKLLKYYLNATKQDLDNIPVWQRPSSSQASTKHPIIIDLFTWPSLRSRFLSQHSLLSRSNVLSFYYRNCIRFDWPFRFEDTFFHDDVSGSYLPSPLFEMYGSNLKNWMMDERFYENFPEMRADIEGDRILYAQVEV